MVKLMCMTLKENNQKDPSAEPSSNGVNTDERIMILHNDEINSFDYVIKSLVDICNHDAYQAEQCAFITHYKGKCDIKNGTYKKLAPLKNQLIEKGLSITIY